MKKLYTASLITLLFSVLASPLLLASHAYASAWLPTYNYKTLNGTSIVHRTLTPDGNDQPYIYKERVNNLKITAPTTNTSSNLRELFWPANSPEVLNAESCSTWSYQSDSLTQQGAALRIVETPTGMRAVTVTKNIMFGASWVFNVHAWDTSQPGLNQLAGFDMNHVTGKFYFDENGVFQNNLKPFPWHLCTRLVGNKLQFKVWVTSTDPTNLLYKAKRPSWTDPAHVREVTIPDGWVQPGKTGWFVGHIRPGHTTEFQGLSTSYRPVLPLPLP